MKKYTNKQVAEIVENEGLGYAVQHYMSSEDIKDKELAKQWEVAKGALNTITNILKEYSEYIE